MKYNDSNIQTKVMNIVFYVSKVGDINKHSSLLIFAFLDWGTSPTYSVIRVWYSRIYLEAVTHENKDPQWS